MRRHRARARRRAAAGESAGSGCQCVRSSGRSSASSSSLADAAVSVSVHGMELERGERPASAMRVDERGGALGDAATFVAGDDAGVTPSSVQIRTIGAPSASRGVEHRVDRAASSSPSGGAMPRYEPYDTTSTPGVATPAPRAPRPSAPPPGGAWPSAPHSMPSTPARHRDARARRRRSSDRNVIEQSPGAMLIDGCASASPS